MHIERFRTMRGWGRVGRGGGGGGVGKGWGMCSWKYENYLLNLKLTLKDLFEHFFPQMLQIVPCFMSDISFKKCESVNPFSVMFLTDTDFLKKNHINKPCMQGVKYTQTFQIVPCTLPNISWKFRKNPSMRLPERLLTNKQTYKQTDRPTCKTTEMKTKPSPFGGGNKNKVLSLLWDIMAYVSRYVQIRIKQ